MTSTSGVSAGSSLLDQYQISGSTSEEDSSLGQDQFLKLLVTQLNNQDPLNPQENGEFIAQLAQFSTVEGIQKLNGSVDSLLTDYQSSQALQASSLVGRKVIVPTDSAVVDTSETFKASLALPASSGNVYVNVYDAAGAQVDRIELGQQQAGAISFMWDGLSAKGEQMPPGTYRFEAQAVYDNETQGLSTMLPANVDSVTLSQNGGEMRLNLAGLGSVALSQVQVIGQ